MAANFNLRFGEDVPEEGRKATIAQAEALIQSLLHDESEKRRAVSIISSLGGDFMFHFFDPKTTEMILNPDGTLWHEKLASPMTKFGRLDKFDAKKVLGLVADYSGKTVDANSPMLSANFPLDGSRFQGYVPPAVHQASFILRKKARAIFTLDDYVRTSGLNETQLKEIHTAVVNRKNILIVGGTGTGKTTLMNAIIEDISKTHPNNRILTIEDTEELQVSSANKLSLLTTPSLTMDDLIKGALRSRPDHILVGEVRGKEALSVLDAWSTGHPGGAATIHANSALEGLDHLAGLVTRHDDAPPYNEILKLVGTAVDLVVHIARFNGKRKVHSVLYVDSYDRKNECFLYRQHFADGRVEGNLLSTSVGENS